MISRHEIFSKCFIPFDPRHFRSAQINLPREERRDATKLYNPMTIKELSQKVPGIPWLDYMNTILAPHHVLTEKERVIVDVPDYFPKLIELLAQTPKRSLFFFPLTFTDYSCHQLVYHLRTQDFGQLLDVESIGRIRQLFERSC